MINQTIKWWLSINKKKHMTSVIILVISIILSSLTFIFLIHFQMELINTNDRFFRDFSSLVAYDLINLIQELNKIDLSDFFEQIYLTTASLDYLQLFDSQGKLLLSLPANSLFYEHIINLHLDILDSQPFISFFNISIVSSSILFKDSVANCLVPLVIDHEILGFLQLGFNYHNSLFYTNALAQNASSLIFVIVWLIFILGAAFNFFIFIDPINELLRGMNNVSFGDFSQNIILLTSGLCGNLIISFNEMCKRLQFYEKNNITQLISEKAKLESLVSTIADGAILLDTELRILLVNQIASKVFHWSNKDLIGSIIFQHLPIHVNDALLPILNSMVKSNCLDNKHIQSQEVIINLNDESLKAFRFLLSTILNYKSQGFNGIVIIIEDITRENQLNEAKNQFVSNVSHELRTPLCNIGSFLETLIDYKYKLTPEQKDQFLDIAYAETQRLNSLVNDILDLSRLESECRYILKPVILTHTVVYIVQASQIIALNKKVKILVEVDPAIKNIFAHQSSLCQVLSNLISNSLKFTHKDGRIIIRVYPLLIKQCKNSFYSPSPEIIRLEIIDEGIGIHKMFQQHIFDRFMRIENNIHTLKGTGLGLSIVQNIIKRHNSMISVYSEVNIGTSFWFDLLIAT